MSVRLLKILCALLFLIFAINLILHLATKSNPDSPFSKTKSFLDTIIGKAITKDPLYAFLKTEAQNLDGTWAIAIKDLKNNKTYFHNETQVFPSASLYKLAVMWKAYEQLESGNLKKIDILTEDKEKLDTILLGETEEEQKEASEKKAAEGEDQKPPEEKGKILMEVEDALFQMITISNNYAAILLSERLGWNNIDELMEKEGLENFNIENDITLDAKSTLELLERIYRGTAVNKTASDGMLKLLLAQRLNDRIPKYLPKEIIVAHKTGELGSAKHDAGIVYGKNANYIFVFLTETANPQNAAEEIAKLSKKIFDKLEKTNN